MSRPATTEEIVAALKEKYKTSHFFTINKFSLAKKYNCRAESSTFYHGGYRWKLFVYPNGYPENVSDDVAIVVEKQDSIDEDIELQLFVVNQLKPIWHANGNIILPPDWNWKGDSDLMSHVDLKRKGYLIDDCIIFGVKFFGIEPAILGSADCFRLIEKPPNHKVTWMMTKFSSFNPYDVHHSNEFVVGNRKWRIQVHPRGFKEGKKKSFSVYLVGQGFIDNVPQSANTYAKFKLRVLDQVSRYHIEKTFSADWLGEEPDVCHGFPEFMPLEILDEPYLVNDKLYVGVEFELISETNYC